MSTIILVTGIMVIIAIPGRNQLLPKRRKAAQSSPAQESRKKKANWRRLFMTMVQYALPEKSLPVV